MVYVESIRTDYTQLLTAFGKPCEKSFSRVSSRREEGGGTVHQANDCGRSRVSVVIDPVCSPGIKNQTGCAVTLKKCYGELQVEAAVVYDLDLGVRLDEGSKHANITKVPLETEDDERAELIAGQLAKKCKVKVRPREPIE